jgi:hypothetical protein
MFPCDLRGTLPGELRCHGANETMPRDFDDERIEDPKVLGPVVHEPLRHEEVDDSISGVRTLSAGIAPEELPTGGRESDGLFDKQAALDRVGGSRDLLRSMGGFFAAQWRMRLAAIGAAAGLRDSGVLKVNANVLRQSLGSFGAVRASGIVLQLEVLSSKREYDALKRTCEDLRIEVERLVCALNEFSRENATTGSR